ncbi:MAG: hypothetical protein KGM42_08520 [Hyphomicrobiales bacterium]|nr:hypothetical protein [Hyphomicrobiales bacterium]
MSKKRNFLRDRRASMTTTFALSLVPVMGAVGASIDYYRYVSSGSNLQAIADEAVLAAQSQKTPPSTSAALQTFITGQITDSAVSISSATYTSSNGMMCTTLTKSVPTIVMQAVGIRTMSSSATACSEMVSTGSGSSTPTTYEIALALDNTGSMSTQDSAGTSKIANEIYYAKQFVNNVFTNDTGNVKVSVVPFTTAVNVGTSNNTASWIDTTGKSSIHWENFPKIGTGGSTWQQSGEAAISSRFDLFTQVGQSWGGCVEERPGSAYTLTDAAPDATKPDSLYVPMFAPDEADSAKSGNSYNSYISDSGGTCSSGDAYSTLDGGATVNSVKGQFADATSFFGDGQSKFCKYLVKWAAANPSAATQSTMLQSSVSTWFSNATNANWNTCKSTSACYQVSGSYNGQSGYVFNPTSSQLASLLASTSGLTTVNSSSTSVSFCTNISVTATCTSGSGYNCSAISYSNAKCGGSWKVYSDNDKSTTYAGTQSTSLPSNYPVSTNIQTTGTATVGSSTSTATNYGGLSTTTGWSGSGFNFGGSGWGTGGGWGWGKNVTNATCGFNQGNNLGYSAPTSGTATAQTSSNYIGSNQFNLGGGANSGCDATLQPLQTLTDSASTVTALIDKMKADGATNLVSGFLWAWRTLSPNGPFNTGSYTSPKAYDTSATPSNHKIIVFMTDGVNNWEPTNTKNGSVYSSFGYLHNRRINQTLTSVDGKTTYAAGTAPTASNSRAYLDAALNQACTNAKAQGVEIYTIGITVGHGSNLEIDSQGQALLKACATDASHYQLVSDPSISNNGSSAGIAPTLQTAMAAISNKVQASSSGKIAKLVPPPTK